MDPLEMSQYTQRILQFYDLSDVVVYFYPLMCNIMSSSVYFHFWICSADLNVK